jgi:chemotaxis protein CheZ
VSAVRTADLTPGALEPGGAAPVQTLSAYEIFQRVGELTRHLHDALRELSHNEGLAQAVHELPDARDRLNYIATLTGRAAERVLAGVERAKEKQELLRAEAAALAGEGETRAFLEALPARLDDVDRELTEIMLAQDFHDLTGQVVQRIGKLVRSLEQNLVNLLIETAPAERRREASAAGLSGPVVNASGRDDVVTSQRQVDELLASLGF